MQSRRALNHRLSGYASIECRQLPLMRECECQQVAVCDMRRIEKRSRINPLRVQHGDIVRPESMPRQFPEGRQQLGHSRGRTGTVGISGMPDNAQYSIFCQRAGRPRLMPFCRKPDVRAIMKHMSGIDQGDQYVHIEKKPRHGNSSRSCCTSSEVTRVAPFRSLRRGTPFRLLALLSGGDRARRAKEEITSPIDLFSYVAISFAALSTSSSITSVVRIGICGHASNINHQSSYIKCACQNNRLDLITASFLHQALVKSGRNL